MISMSTKQDIIIRWFREGNSERKISRELKISRTTVRRYIKEYQKAKSLLLENEFHDDQLIDNIVKSPRYNSFNRGKRKLNMEVIKEIDRLLAINDQKRSRGLHKQLMKKIDILEHIQEKGFNIGYTSVCNYIREKTARPKEAYIRQVYTPGDTCEFDWGEVKLNINGCYKTFNMAVFFPALSNYRFAILFVRQDSASFQQAHVNFFDHVGGVYHIMVYDNMRVVISKFVGISEKEPTEALLKLSIYYNFRFRFCNAYRGNEKGHVERSVEFIRRKAFSLKDDFKSMEEANRWLLKTCNSLNTCYNRILGGKKAIDLFKQEKEYLYPAPPRFDCASMDQGRVDKYSVVSFATNRYSVPDHLVGKIVDIKIYPEKLVCYYEKQKICEHERHYGQNDWHIDLEHYLNTLKVKPGALAGSLALKTAPKEVSKIYQAYFTNNPKSFVELLLFNRDNNIGFDKVNKAIEKLKIICPNDISFDKIKALCMQKNRYDATVENNNDEILQKSREQLIELSLLLCDKNKSINNYKRIN
ncbi:MAG: IS21 family transposase [Bacteroidetes bacterium]|nr:IS21 family transposase [Bacteroidota bacterium]